MMCKEALPTRAVNELMARLLGHIEPGMRLAQVAPLKNISRLRHSGWMHVRAPNIWSSETSIAVPSTCLIECGVGIYALAVQQHAVRGGCVRMLCAHADHRPRHHREPAAL
eukprot:4872070-Prymnesium_polylepis.2